jgi:hypothetical protein
VKSPLNQVRFADFFFGPLIYPKSAILLRVAVPVDGNVTDELLEEFYGQEIPVENTERPALSNLNPGVEKKSGETTHARKEITPGRIMDIFKMTFIDCTGR